MVAADSGEASHGPCAEARCRPSQPCGARFSRRPQLSILTLPPLRRGSCYRRREPTSPNEERTPFVVRDSTGNTQGPVPEQDTFGSSQKNKKTFKVVWLDIKSRVRHTKPDQWTSISTFILAIATIWLACAVYRQLIIMEEDQRPWVGSRALGVIPNDNIFVGGYFYIDLINTGKSPALNVSLTLLNWNTDINTVQFPINKCAGACRFENVELLPGSPLQVRIPEYGKQPLPKAGDTGYIIARIDYLDSRGQGM